MNPDSHRPSTIEVVGLSILVTMIGVGLVAVIAPDGVVKSALRVALAWTT